MAIAISGMVVYHLLQKSIHADANPVVSLVATYLTALAGSVLLLPLYPIQDDVLGSIRTVSWPSYALGLSVVAIELGFLLVYRAGWTLTVAAGYANVVTILALFPIGLWIYGETLSSRKLLGIALAASAVYLLSD